MRVRTLLAAAALALAAVIGAGAAEAAKYAAIIVDADTQEVLHEVNADARTYPASLTKMMTLYLVFEALETGKLRTDQTLPVSAHAANRAPSKLGLVAGETVGVRDLILGLVTKSANDAASVIAEGLAGSEAAFAERMTQKARKLGMTNTVFRNASGLPDPGQVTTARDYSKLSIALYRDFPKHWHYFSTQTFSFRGRTFANHNHLMERFEGMDGIKTGFINASGFNLAASAVRNNRRLIGVVMGGESARGRDQHMAQLLNAAFATRRGTRSPTLMVDAAPQEGATQVAASSEDAEDAAPQPSLARRVAKSLNPIGTAEAAAPAASTRRLAEKGGWSLQLGAFTQKAAAHKAAADAAARLGKKKAVQVIAPAKGDKEKVFRARLTGFGKKDAQEACRQLHRKRHACVVVGPSA